MAEVESPYCPRSKALHGGINSIPDLPHSEHRGCSHAAARRTTRNESARRRSLSRVVAWLAQSRNRAGAPEDGRDRHEARRCEAIATEQTKTRSSSAFKSLCSLSQLWNILTRFSNYSISKITPLDNIDALELSQLSLRWTNTSIVTQSISQKPAGQATLASLQKPNVKYRDRHVSSVPSEQRQTSNRMLPGERSK